VPQTLLLADDSATIQRVIELTFAGEDIQVVSVSDGDQAIARLAASPPDIVLADVGMPGKNGYEVAEYVKRTPSLAHIPVVLLTGAFEPVDQAKAAAVGCAGVLAKPFEPQIVISRVRELLGRSSSAERNPPATSSHAVAADPFAFAPAPEPAPAEPVVEVAPEAKVEDYFDRLDAAFATLSTAPAAKPAAPAPAPVVDELDWLRPKAEAPRAAAAQEFAIADAFALEPVTVAEPDVVADLEPEPEPELEPEPEFEPEVVAAPVAVAEPEVIFEPEAEPEPEPAFASIPLAKFEPESEPEPLEPPEPEPLAPLEPLEPLERSAPRVLPSIADAFGVILAAEQDALGVRPEWPSPSHAPDAVVASAAPAELVITSDLVDRVATRVLEQLSDRIVRETVAAIASDAAERLVKEEIERIKASIK
jgi:CheY-like chemotaxis protein